MGAGAGVTDRGGRTCHAAVIVRELAIPAVVGSGDAAGELGFVIGSATGVHPKAPLNYGRLDAAHLSCGVLYHNPRSHWLFNYED